MLIQASPALGEKLNFNKSVWEKQLFSPNLSYILAKGGKVTFKEFAKIKIEKPHLKTSYSM